MNDLGVNQLAFPPSMREARLILKIPISAIYNDFKLIKVSKKVASENKQGKNMRNSGVYWSE